MGSQSLSGNGRRRRRRAEWWTSVAMFLLLVLTRLSADGSRHAILKSSPRRAKQEQHLLWRRDWRGNEKLKRLGVGYSRSIRFGRVFGAKRQKSRFHKDAYVSSLTPPPSPPPAKRRWAMRRLKLFFSPLPFKAVPSLLTAFDPSTVSLSHCKPRPGRYYS